jgi:murein L,D-transpeptidase YafK
VILPNPSIVKVSILFAVMLTQATFKQSQLDYARVKTAYDEKEEAVKNVFDRRNVAYRGFQMFIRAFKKEQLVEVWVKEAGKESWSYLNSYDFCSSSGTLGPKRKEGDLQIPEGVYTINHFNPQSNFYLSLGISYPNASDKILSDPRKPGGDIYLHGNCVTIGCIPITDDKIKELYVMAVEARNNGQEKIPVHIFPTRLSTEQLNVLRKNYPTSTVAFWENLKVVYDDFELTKKLKPLKVKKNGEYSF